MRVAGGAERRWLVDVHLKYTRFASEFERTWSVSRALTVKNEMPLRVKEWSTGI